MKKVSFILLVFSMILSSCSKDDEGSKIEVAFDRISYAIPFSENKQEVSVKLSFGSTVPEKTSIGLIYSGSAEEPFDFKALDNLPLREGDLGSEFIIEIQYNPSNTSAKDIKINLELPQGYKLGSNSSTVINIASK